MASIKAQKDSIYLSEGMQRAILEGRWDIYLELRKVVIGEFLEYLDSSDEVDVADLLSNVLVGIEDYFKTE